MSEQEIEIAVNGLLSEYTELKTEQTQRIGFRDNMVFVHLAICGAIGS